MLGPKLIKLVSISGSPICNQEPRLPTSLISIAGKPGQELQELLRQKNGFYAFEGALHLRPSNCTTQAADIERWNRDELWREMYSVVVEGQLFFAEDIFGGQFSILGGKVCRFDPETGSTKEMAKSLDEWAGLLLENYDFETGYSLAHEWQQIHGPLAQGKRLVPKTPFELGGEYKVANLYAADEVESTRLRADIWRQIKDLPEGTKVRLKVVR